MINLSDNFYYFELKCVAYIKKDILFKEVFEKLSKYISYSMLQNEVLKDLHQNSGFKYYCFDGLFPIEKEKIYKKGSNYIFHIRSINKELIDNLFDELRKNINNPNLLIVDITKKRIKQFFINELYTLTPVIMTIENGLYWTIKKDGNILKLQKQLHDNIEKKYKNFFDQNLQPIQNFIQLIEIKNQKPQTIEVLKDGKKIKFFGNKFRIVPHEDEISQKLAFLALGCGLGEKNSYGGGFCVAKGLKL